MGLTFNNSTAYTLNGIGGFAGAYRLVKASFTDLLEGSPTQLPRRLHSWASSLLTRRRGSAQSIEGTGVAPNPALGRVFFLGEPLAGTANPVLLSFDSSRYVLLGMQQVTGAAQGRDLLRWGRRARLAYEQRRSLRQQYAWFTTGFPDVWTFRAAGMEHG